jgi:hypothetical protein
MYGEDIDLSYRIVQGGYKNYYLADTTIIHYKGESTKKGSLNYVKVFYNAMIIFARKHFSGNQSGLFSFVINLAIFFRGFLTLLAGVFSSSYLFIVDALLSFIGVFFIKTYWENMIKYTDHYYPNEFLFIVVPIYILIWIISTYLNGGYDKPYRVSNIIRGILLGTLGIAAVYAFLPEAWRFSRAMILLGAIWTALEMLFTRTCYHLIKYQSLSIENNDEKRTLLVGDIAECTRAGGLLKAAGVSSEVVGMCAENELKKLVVAYRVNEVVFCSKSLSFGSIIYEISGCGTHIEYKILNPESEAFIGSNSKDTAGDVYSVDQNMNLARPVNRRKKRFFDGLCCFLLLPLMPLNILLVKNFGKFIANWGKVLAGKKTWVGYAHGDTSKLPAIPNGVLKVADDIKELALDADALAKMNWLYARYYNVGTDIKLLWHNYRNLGL